MKNKMLLFIIALLSRFMMKLGFDCSLLNVESGSKQFYLRRKAFWKMTIFVCVPFQLLLGFNLGFAEIRCTVPGTTAACSALVSSLPWKFNINTIDDGDKSLIVFQSQEKVGQSGVYLKISLDVSSYKSEVAASAAYTGIYEKSDPDMGLTYSWDFIAAQDTHLFRLHADCTLAEQHFQSIVDAFKDLNRTSAGQISSSFFCRCGGGCSQLQ